MADLSSSVPNIQSQKELIHSHISRAMAKGETWYLVESRWFKAFKHYVGMDDMWDGIGVTDDYPGPIDNMPLFIDDGTYTNTLKDSLIDELDYVLVPSEAWELLVQWYGTVDEKTAIPRQVIEYGVFVKHCKVEVYLLEVRLCKNWKTDEAVSHKFSKGDKVEHIEKTMRKIFDIKDNEATHLWSGYSGNVYDELNKLESTVQDAGLYQNQLIVIETADYDGTHSRPCRKTASNIVSSTQTSATADRTTAGTSGGGIMPTRYNPYSYPSESRAAPGLCGLCNLGNTCFMNSVLQCMSNCPPITKYFLNDEHLPELNEENPLGMKGEIAKAFGELIKIMWSGKHSYTMPHQFKLQVGRFAPQFLGYQQHDSQELLTFLLDGLHEDLNRIKKKPYIELQDSPGRPDKEVAKEAWENYRKRNDSIIVDFFHGLLKSTVVCPDCSKVSITFDPFCYLSLPLPTKKERALEVLLFQYNPELKPTHYTVIVPKRGFIKDLVSNIGRLSGIPSDHLIVTEVSRSHFHKFFASNDPIEKIEDKDMIYIYEMPLDSNTHVIMPVYLWESTGKQAFNQDQLFGDPILVAAPRKDCTYDLLYQLVIHKLKRYLKVPDDNSSWWFPKTQKITNGELAPTDDDTTDENDKVMCSDCERRRLFTFYLMTTTQNGTDAVKLHNDGNPLELPMAEYMGQNFIALRWSQEARERFFYEKTMEDTEDDQSTKNNLQALKLRDCIELYTTREKLGADDAWYCPSCKKHQQATKKFDLWSLPRILIIHLKRFVYNRLRRDKVDRTVHYPIRGLNMSEYVINEEHPEAVYDLIGVCNHYGGLGGGHYTACCQNINDKKWYLFDDNTVTEMKEQNVISNAAYVLFYMRRDPDDGQTHMELN